MDDELEDQESSDQEPTGFGALPKETQAELKKLRKENESIRKRLLERDAEVLTVKYGEDIVSMIPEEVTTYERRAELAEIYKAKLGGTPEATPEGENGTAPAAQATEPEPTGLASVSGTTPAPGSATSGELLTVAEIKALAKTDPIRANQLVAQGKFQQAAPL